MTTRPSDCFVTCPAPDCDYGPDDGPAVLRGKTMPAALKARDEHLRSAHRGWRPPRGSIADRVPRLD